MRVTRALRWPRPANIPTPAPRTHLAHTRPWKSKGAHRGPARRDDRRDRPGRQETPVATLRLETPVATLPPPPMPPPPDTEAYPRVEISSASKQPRQHQQEAVDRIVAEFRGGASRGILVMPPGTGKTLVMYWAARALHPTGVIVLCVPSLTLLSQTLRTWLEMDSNTDTKPAFLAVGSDVSVEGVARTTDTRTVATFLEENKNCVVLSTYQSLQRVKEAFGMVPEARADLVLCDEAHNACVSVDRPFALVLDAAGVPARRRLFATATVRVFTGKSVVSMDSEELFGRTMFEYSIARARSDGNISNYRLVFLLHNETEPDMVAAGLAKVMNGNLLEPAPRRVLSYHNSVLAAEMFCGWMERAGVKSNTLNATHSVPQRDDIVLDFRQSDQAVLTSCRVLSEGVDMPEADAVCFSEPRLSSTEVVQCAGRALRLLPGATKVASIIIPTQVQKSRGRMRAGQHDALVNRLLAVSTAGYGSAASVDKHFFLFRNNEVVDVTAGSEDFFRGVLLKMSGKLRKVLEPDKQQPLVQRFAGKRWVAKVRVRLFSEPGPGNETPDSRSVAAGASGSILKQRFGFVQDEETELWLPLFHAEQSALAVVDAP